MSIRIVQLGTERQPGEGTRFGTVRRPPRGVSKERYAAENWYDVWLPILAPSADLMTAGRRSDSPQSWAAFTKRYRAEMNRTDARQVLAALAALSRHVNFSVGCYCEDESSCHRSILREVLVEHGAKVSD